MSLDKLQKYVMERKPGMMERKPVHGVSCPVLTVAS